MYVYAANNPIKYTDPDGRNTYLIIWATDNNQSGHAAFAVDNYYEDGTPDGTVTFYELGPDQGIPDNPLKTVDAYFNKKTVFKISLTKKVNLSDYENTKPDGVIEFFTDIKTDAKIQKKMERFMKIKKYNAVFRNCSNMARIGVKYSVKGFKFNHGKEKFLFFSFVTPNKLFNDAKKFPNIITHVDKKRKTSVQFVDAQIRPILRAKKNHDNSEIK